MKTRFQFLFNEAGESAGGGATPAATADAGQQQAAADPTSLLGDAGGQQQAQPAPTWVNPDGTFNHDALPQDLQSYGALKTIKGVNDLAKAFGETKKLVGSKFAPPTPDAPEQQIAEWKKTIGAPLTAAEYEMVKDGLPEGVPIDENLHKAIAEVAHKHHIPAAAWAELLGTYNKHVAGGLEQSTAAQVAEDQKFVADQLNELKTAWGNDFDKNKNAAAKVAAIAGIPTDHPALQFAEVVKGLATLAGNFSETAAAALVPTAGTLGGGKSQAMSIINDKGNPLHDAYWNPSHPNYNSTVAMVQNLMKQG
jgi:hypothetical protein